MATKKNLSIDPCHLKFLETVQLRLAVGKKRLDI